jgi:hypothetical protein
MDAHTLSRQYTALRHVHYYIDFVEMSCHPRRMDDTQHVPPLTNQEQESIKSLVAQSGYVKAARRMRISYHVLLRAIGGLGLRDGSLLMIRRGLAGNP